MRKHAGRCLIVFALVVLPACREEFTESEVVAGELEEDSALAVNPAAVDAAMVQAVPGVTTQEVLEEGRRLYVVCSVCHGLDGSGTQLAPNLRDDTWIHISGEINEIARITRDGVPTPSEAPIPMPVMGGGSFDERQLQSVAAYVYALRRRSS
jgi:mono/diheme cytochrome c family protein